MDTIILTKKEFLDKFNSGEYDFISESDNYSPRSFSMPGNLIDEYDPKFHNRECFEVSHMIEGIKLIYYLRVDVVKGFLGISYKLEQNVFEITDADGDIFYYKVPEKVILSCRTNLNQWKLSIQTGYEMVISAKTKSIIFTNDDVFSHLFERLGDIYDNIQNGINNLLILNNINKRISLYSANCIITSTD